MTRESELSADHKVNKDSAKGERGGATYIYIIYIYYMYICMCIGETFDGPSFSLTGKCSKRFITGIRFRRSERVCVTLLADALAAVFSEKRA